MTAEADPHEPGARVDTARVAELCERLRQLGHQAGESALRQARQRAEALVAEARERAHAESQLKIARARQRLARQRERERQAARLEARATIAWCHWRELDAVLDAAQRHVESLSDTEPERYLNALHRFLDLARLVLPPRALIVHAHPDDLARLQRAGVQGSTESEPVHVGDTNIRTGLVVTSADGGVFVDQTIAGRRQRLDELLRLAAAEVLFGAHAEGRSPISAG
jgi:vacuolar-type H+-ATPase subunit E/Vma4